MSISNTHSKNLLSIRGLKTHFYTDNGVGKAVDGLDLDLQPLEILGIVGESGCGKSVTALSILRLVPSPQGRIVGGQIFFKETVWHQKTSLNISCISLADLTSYAR